MKDRRKMIEKEIGLYGEDANQHLRGPVKDGEIAK